MEHLIHYIIRDDRAAVKGTDKLIPHESPFQSPFERQFDTVLVQICMIYNLVESFLDKSTDAEQRSKE
ncbi:hypothetical protein AFLA_012524 [Aspergillus flavus NRRL3357]|nr:hypothetical protein AFLA_012524 [Aspergillus flavus NRRL3357]